MELGLQSLGAYIVGDKNHGTFFSFTSILGLAGEILGGPIMAKMYAFRDQDQRPLGYSFFLSMVCLGTKIFPTLYLTSKTGFIQLSLVMQLFRSNRPTPILTLCSYLGKRSTTACQDLDFVLRYTLRAPYCMHSLPLRG